MSNYSQVFISALSLWYTSSLTMSVSERNVGIAEMLSYSRLAEQTALCSSPHHFLRSHLQERAVPDLHGFSPEQTLTLARRPAAPGLVLRRSPGGRGATAPAWGCPGRAGPFPRRAGALPSASESSPSGVTALGSHANSFQKVCKVTKKASRKNRYIYKEK